MYENRLNKFLDEVYELNDIPGISVGVSIGSYFDFKASRGFRDITACKGSKSAHIEPSDVFHCASVSKLFTSSAVIKLVSDGVLNLHDFLVDLLPDLPFEDSRVKDVRLWNLLTHTSGLGDCDDYKWYAPDMEADAIKRYVYSDEVCKQPMLWEPQPAPADPDNRFRYSNVAYEILGHIVARYGAESSASSEYEDLIKAWFFDPLGMTSSSMRTFARPDWGAPSMCAPHEKKPDGTISLCADYPYNPAHAPSSTLTTNTADLLKWARYNLDISRPEGSLYEQVWSEFATVPNNGEKMGLGWFMRKQKAGGHTFQLYGHEGTDDGFRASFWICPELDVATVVLSNMSGAPVKRINKQLFTVVAELLGY